MSKKHEGDRRQGRADNPLQEAEALIWALLDDQLGDADSQRLSALMAENAAVRARYLDCVQLHVDLTEHFALKPVSPGAAPAIVPNLMPGFPSMPGFVPAAE